MWTASTTRTRPARSNDALGAAPTGQSRRPVASSRRCLAPSAVFAAAYVSTPTVDFSDRDLSLLLLAARRFNARHGITGKLVAAEIDVPGGGTRVVRFVQWIEGDAADVRACLRRIHADPRHGDIEIQLFGPVEARRFPEWDMAIATVPASTADVAAREMVPDPHPVAFESLDLV